MAMSPKAKQSALNISAAIGAVSAVAALMAPAARAVDARYVKTTTYSRDSINLYYRQQYIAAKLAKIDSIDAKVDTIKVMLRSRR